MTDSYAFVAAHAIGGLAVLCLGRRLFWLFVAMAGFVIAFELAPLLLPVREPWLLWVVALGAGLVGAVVAVWLQYWAAMLAGFAAGVYVAFPFAADLGGSPWVSLLAGVLGALLMLFVFDGALIVLSALIGARALVAVSPLGGVAATATWLVLAAIGVAVQVSFVTPTRRPVRR